MKFKIGHVVVGDRALQEGTHFLRVVISISVYEYIYNLYRPDGSRVNDAHPYYIPSSDIEDMDTHELYTDFFAEEP